MEHPDHAATHSRPAGLGPYRALLGMTVLSYIAMYVLMYAMVDHWANVFNNVNQACMAGLMAIPMALIERVLMRGMYRTARLMPSSRLPHCW